MNNDNNDRPSVDFNFDTYKAETKAKPYGVVISGRRIELPPATELNGIAFFENALKGDSAATLALLHEAMDDDDFAALRKVSTIGNLQAFIESYLAASGLATAGD